MSGQERFFDVPRARNRVTPEGRVVRDPDTSFAAARSLSSDRISTLQRAILSTRPCSGALSVPHRTRAREADDVELCAHLAARAVP